MHTVKSKHEIYFSYMEIYVLTVNKHDSATTRYNIDYRAAVFLNSD